MPRKKARFTLKKKANKKADRAAPEGLSERQFAALPNDYGSFMLEDAEHEYHTFSVNDVAYILHQGSGETGDALNDNHWIGQIQEIRGDGPHNVWVRVQWYWSPEEVADVIKCFDPAICGKYEKLFSNNFDIVSTFCFSEHVEVKSFDETSVYQDTIADGEWYSRYYFSYDGRRVTPKVTHEACAICKIPYTPGVTKVLHFCPRPNCRKFYHQSCLVKKGYVEESREYRVLETWPDVDRTESIEEISTSYRPKKRQKRDDSLPGEGTCESSDPLADFPTELVAVAEQQIVRGTEDGGIVGNITSVVAARQLIYRALGEGLALPADWKAKIDISATFFNAETFPNCKCPSCCSPI